MAEITINLKDYSYNVYIDFALDGIGNLLKHERFGNKALILSDSKVFGLYGEVLTDTLKSEGKIVDTCIVEQGEKSKSFNEVYSILEKCAANSMSRDDTIITLGGGVVSDLGGFAASIYMRGMNFAAVPTTLLAQVDASVGGKTGVNMPSGKNMIGSFYQPAFVLIDTVTLETLPLREMKQGVAEIIKYGIIKSADIYSITANASEKIEKNLSFLISESLRIKKGVVEEDEKETKGYREILNFGHTLGHALEISLFPELNHGEAVALGMAGETYIAYKLGICRRDLYDSVENTIRARGLPSTFEGIDISRAADLLRYDKKVRKDRIRFVLPEKIGSVRTGVVVSSTDAERILKELC